MRTYENKDELKNEINKVKIVFFDIDGTLLEMGKTEITPNTRKNGVLCRKASCPDTKKKFGRHGKAQWSNSRTISLPN